MRKKGGEGVVVCSDRNMGAGISILDLETGDRIVHIPTCASPPNGLLCLRDQFLVASQVSKHGSVGGGAVFTWCLNKPQSPLRSYPIEAIGPLACTKDGVYLAGGSPTGNGYVWEVTSGRLLKTWRAHHKSLKCMVFSDDDSLLVSGSDNGMICVWSMIGLLDVDDFGSSSSLLHFSSEHQSSITGLLTSSGCTNPIFISSSLDATCKAWEMVSGRIIQTQEYPLGVTSIVLHPATQLLFAGCTDGRIFVSELNVGLLEDPFVVEEDQPVVLKGHNMQLNFHSIIIKTVTKLVIMMAQPSLCLHTPYYLIPKTCGSITALTFSTSGLISASEDHTVCLWDIASQTILRRFNHKKGAVTNLAVISESALLSVSNRPRVPNQFRVALLDKCPQSAYSPGGTVTLLHSCSSTKECQTSLDFQRTSSFDQQISEIEKDQTPTAIQMKVDTSIDNRAWATKMTRHVMDMNKHLQTRLLDLMQMRLFWSTENDSQNVRKNKKLKTKSPALGPEELSQSPD